VVVALHEKWQDTAIDGEVCSAWAERKRPHLNRQAT